MDMKTQFIFFYLETVIEKAEWKWNAKQGTIVNLISRKLDGLELVDNNYYFSVAFQAENVKNKTKGQIETKISQLAGKMTATELVLSKINLILNVQDVDSVSMLRNPMYPRHLQRRKSALMYN